MKITYKNAVKQTKKFLQGGTVGAPADGTEAPMPQEEVPTEEVPAGGEDPMIQLALIFAQGLQNQDCQILAQGAQMFLQLMEQSQGGQPQEPLGEPVFAKNGAKLLYRIKL